MSWFSGMWLLKSNFHHPEVKTRVESLIRWVMGAELPVPSRLQVWEVQVRTWAGWNPEGFPLLHSRLNCKQQIKGSSLWKLQTAKFIFLRESMCFQCFSGNTHALYSRSAAVQRNSVSHEESILSSSGAKASQREEPGMQWSLYTKKPREMHFTANLSQYLTQTCNT